MKIQVTLTIDVDPAKWDDEYGVGRDSETYTTRNQAVESDVRRYVVNAIQQSEGMQATGAEVSSR